MLHGNIKLPTIYMDLYDLLQEKFSHKTRLLFKEYGEKTPIQFNFCDVVHFSMDKAIEEDQHANADVAIIYIEKIITGELFSTVERVRNLRFFCSEGDIGWTPRMIHKVWEGDYPSTVALDLDTKEVFFVGVKAHYVEFLRFATLTDEQFEAISFDANDRTPYEIRIQEQAMFDYIDGAEGLRHLKENLYIKFHCGVPVHVEGNLSTTVER